MSRFQTHTVESAPQGSQRALKQAQQALGFLPNLLGTFAEAPAALDAYLGIGRAFDRTSFSPTERQIVLLTTSDANRCAYCAAAHSTIAHLQDVPDEVVAALRDGEPLPDARLEALRVLTRSVVERRGWVSDAELQAFLDAGYTRAHVFEVIVGVAMKTLSNYTNHIADTPLDEAFEPRAWPRLESVPSPGA